MLRSLVGSEMCIRDSIPPPKRKVQVPPNPPRPQRILRRMVSKVRHHHRWPTLGQEDRGRHLSLGTLPPRAQNNCKKLQKLEHHTVQDEVRNREADTIRWLPGGRKRGQTGPGQNPGHYRLPAANESDRGQIISLACPATFLFRSRFLPRHSSHQTTPQ